MLGVLKLQSTACFTALCSVITQEKVMANVRASFSPPVLPNQTTTTIT